MDRVNLVSKMKSLIVVILFYLINFKVWDLLVDNQILGPRWAAFAVYTVLFILTIALFHGHLKQSWNDFKAEISSPWRFFLEVVLWAVAGSLITSALIFLFNRLFGLDVLPGNQENVNDMVQELPAILSFVMMAIYAPIIEELTFRHAIIGWVDPDNKTLLWIMTVISIVLFDMIHVMHPPEFFYYLPLSIILTTIYQRHQQNVWASILFHAFFNAMGFLFILLGLIPN